MILTLKKFVRKEQPLCSLFLDILLKNDRLKNIDLSNNNIGKQGGMLIAKMLRYGNLNLEWLDISRNNFHHHSNVITRITEGLRFQKNLYHLAMDTSPVTTINLENTEKEFHSSEKITNLLLVISSSFKL